ncbi:hypothetical protein ADUPG1_012259, partial [Aduncisulcus paluster]
MSCSIELKSILNLSNVKAFSKGSVYFRDTQLAVIVSVLDAITLTPAEVKSIPLSVDDISTPFNVDPFISKSIEFEPPPIKSAFARSITRLSFTLNDEHTLDFALSELFIEDILVIFQVVISDDDGQDVTPFVSSAAHPPSTVEKRWKTIAWSYFWPSEALRWIEDGSEHVPLSKNEQKILNKDLEREIAWKQQIQWLKSSASHDLRAHRDESSEIEEDSQKGRKKEHKKGKSE